VCSCSQSGEGASTGMLHTSGNQMTEVGGP